MADKILLDVALRRIGDYAKARKIKVPNPHTAWFERKFIVSQIKVYGNVYYYQFPASAGSKIVAWWYSGSSTASLDLGKGYEKNFIYNLVKEQVT